MSRAESADRLTGWIAIAGGFFAIANVLLVFVVAGSDQDMILSGKAMLSLSPDAQDLFRLAMAADIFGFYLPFVAIGGYLWHLFRKDAGAVGDMGLILIALYVAVGIAGAAIDLAALPPLTHLYAAGDAASRSAAAATWTALSNTVQSGLWWTEGPLVLGWVLAIGPHLRAARFGAPLLATIIGYTFLLWTIFGYFPSQGDIASLFELVFVILVPIWMIVFGIQLLRGRAPRPTDA